MTIKAKGMSTLLTMSFATVICSFSSVAKAEEESLIRCITRFKAVGISPDAALAECKQQTLAECVKRLMGQNFIASSIKTGPQGYLIDLGNNDSRWLEGGPWKSKGCVPFEEGPKRRQQAITSWGFDSVTQWFRQGWCPSETLEFNQSYGLEDAKLRCELGDLKPVNMKEP